MTIDPGGRQVLLEGLEAMQVLEVLPWNKSSTGSDPLSDSSFAGFSHGPLAHLSSESGKALNNRSHDVFFEPKA